MSFSKYKLPAGVGIITAENVIVEENITLKETLERLDTFDSNVMTDVEKVNLYNISIDKLSDTSSFDTTDPTTSDALSKYYNAEDDTIVIKGGNTVTLKSIEFTIPQDKALTKLNVPYNVGYINLALLGTGYTVYATVYTDDVLADPVNSEDDVVADIYSKVGETNGNVYKLNSSTTTKIRFELTFALMQGAKAESANIKVNSLVWGVGYLIPADN